MASILMASPLILLVLCLCSQAMSMEAREFVKVDNVNLDFYRGTKTALREIYTRIHCTMECEHRGWKKCNAFKHDPSLFACDMYLLLDTKESLPKGNENGIFIASPLAPAEIPAKFLVTHRQMASANESKLVEIRGFNGQVCLELPQLPTYREPSPGSVFATNFKGKCMTFGLSRRDEKKGENRAYQLEKKKIGGWQWQALPELLPKTVMHDFMRSSWYLEMLATLYVFVATPHNRNNLYIYEYDSNGKRFDEVVHFTIGFKIYTSIRGVFIWREETGIVLVVFKNGHVLPVDIRKREIHAGYDKALKDSYKKHIRGNAIALKFAFETSKPSGEEGIVAGDSKQHIYFFLDFDKALEGLVPQKDKMDPTIDTTGKAIRTKIGGAIRMIRKGKSHKYELAVWSARDWKFITTGLETEEEGALDIFYDEALEKVSCKN